MVNSQDCDARNPRAAGAFLAALLILSPSWAFAQDAFLLSVEAHGSVSPVRPQSSWFGPGGGGAVRGHVALHEMFLLGGGIDVTIVSNGDAPGVQGVEDPVAGSIYTLTGSLRIRPLAPIAHSVSRGTGLYVDFAGGAALTGDLIRPVIAATMGYGFGVASLDLAPFVRWQTVFESSNRIDDSAAHVLSVGLGVTFFDPHTEPPQPQTEVIVERVEDTDGDGINDDVDECPNEPEDMDQFEDSDGCPDLDNDADGIPDEDDWCKMEPEDVDGFEDTDGCPEPDNDDDGILDADDHCPIEPERVNGIDDEDGCPDQGLIELVHDHVILEENVLFDFNQSRVLPRAMPSLRAIAELVHQHPEWSQVRIEGHACEQGPHSINQRLSEERAANVHSALVELGVPEDIIDHVGHGEEKPRAWGEDETIHALNRRVEFVVVSRSEVHTVHSPARDGGTSVEHRPVLRDQAVQSEGANQ